MSEPKRPKPPTHFDITPEGYHDHNRYFNEAEHYIDHLEASTRKKIQDTKVNMLEMFCYQGPPSKNWLKTEGRFWEGWNAALDKILSIL